MTGLHTIDLGLQDIELDVDDCRLIFKSISLGGVNINKLYVTICKEDMIKLVEQVLTELKK
jgi:hypothetical protein